MISFTLSRTVWWWVLQTRRGRRGPTLWNFIKVFPLIITPLFSHNNLFYFSYKRWEQRKYNSRRNGTSWREISISQGRVHLIHLAKSLDSVQKRGEGVIRVRVWGVFGHFIDLKNNTSPGLSWRTLSIIKFWINIYIKTNIEMYLLVSMYLICWEILTLI